MHYGQVEKRNGDGGRHADCDEWRFARGAGYRLSILLRIQRIVEDGKGPALFDGNRRAELTVE